MTMENVVAAAARDTAAHPATGRDAHTSRPALKPLVFPTEHGGWGFLLEPLVLGLAVAPSWGGALIAAAAIFAFLARQPLKLAMQDALRAKSYPRTRWCRLFAVAYLGGAGMAIAGAIAVSGWKLTIPFAAVAPLAMVTLVFDARNRSRSLLPEICGSIAMSSTAAAIPLAGGKSLAAAFAVMALLIARGLPAILYVRTLLKRAHGQAASSAPAAAAHAIAVAAAYVIASYLAAAAAVALLIRAAWGLTHPVPPARALGWREMAWGSASVIAFAIALRIHGGM
jgi:YwiC-like protein